MNGSNTLKKISDHGQPPLPAPAKGKSRHGECDNLDYASRFHRPYVRVRYAPKSKTVEAKEVDLEQVLGSDFLETVAIYEDVIIQVLDEVKDKAPDFDFERLKRDLHRAIQEEVGIVK